MNHTTSQTRRINRRRDFFSGVCQRLPGWRWLRLGAHLVGQVACPRCSGRVLVDLGVRALHFPNERGVA